MLWNNPIGQFCVSAQYYQITKYAPQWLIICHIIGWTLLLAGEFRSGSQTWCHQYLQQLVTTIFVRLLKQMNWGQGQESPTDHNSYFYPRCGKVIIHLNTVEVHLLQFRWIWVMILKQDLRSRFQTYYFHFDMF